MHEDETVGIYQWNLSVRELYDNLLDNYPDIQMSEEDFCALLKRALGKYYQDDNEVPAMLLPAGLIRLYQGKT